MVERIVGLANRLLSPFLASLTCAVKPREVETEDHSELVQELYSAYDSSSTDISDEDLLLCCFRALETLTKDLDVKHHNRPSIVTDHLIRIVRDRRLTDFCFKAMDACGKARSEDTQETGKVSI